MNSITKEQAWVIFEAKALGQREGEKALVRMTDEEMAAYEVFAEQFEMAVAQIGVAAQNEAATIQADNPELMVDLQAKSMDRWMAEDYSKAVSMFKGSKFEQLHLSAMFRIQNNELLLELAKASL